MAISRSILRIACASLLAASAVNAAGGTLDTRASNDIKQFSGTADQIANFDPHDYVPSHYWKVRVSHAACMSAVWLVIFPIGGIIPRLISRNPHLITFHAILQMIGFWIVVAAAGMGIWMANEIDQFSNYHPVLGLILLALVCAQPAMEIINHRFYHVDKRVQVMGYIHIWLGRALLVAGVVQGGLGFLFAASFRNADVELWPRIAYGLVAAIMWIIYMIFGVVYPEVLELKQKKIQKKREEPPVAESQLQQQTAQYGQQPGINDFLYGYSERHHSQV